MRGVCISLCVVCMYICMYIQIHVVSMEAAVFIIFSKDFLQRRISIELAHCLTLTVLIR